MKEHATLHWKWSAATGLLDLFSIRHGNSPWHVPLFTHPQPFAAHAQPSKKITLVVREKPAKTIKFMVVPAGSFLTMNASWIACITTPPGPSGLGPGEVFDILCFS